MWMEELPNGKYKFVERYRDPYTDRYKKISVTLSSKTARAKNEAQRVLSDKIAKALNTDPRKMEKRTFEEVATEWLEDYRKDFKDPRKGSTYSVRSYQLDTLLERYMQKEKAYLISALDTDALQTVFNAMLEGGLKTEYIKSLRSVVRMVLTYAKEKRYVTSTEAYDRTYLPKKQLTIAEMEESRVPSYLEQDELARVLEVTARKNKQYAVIFEVQAYTGLRISELLALEASDLDGHTLHVKGTYDNHTRSATKGEKTLPKTSKSYRDVVISERIRTLIADQIEANQLITHKLNEYIFTTRKGNPYLVGVLNAFLRKNKAEMGVTGKLSTHIFRHTHISMLAENNVPLHIIMQRVGHSDRKVTESIYLHVTRKMKTDLFDVLENL